MSAADALDPPRGHHAHPHLFQLKVKLVHTAHRLGKFKNIFNPNHRHDEPHEQAVDAARERIAKSNPHDSFAPVTHGNELKAYVDGRDYFHAVSMALEAARDTIYIADWWLSPELFLRRPPGEDAAKPWRLDRVLKRAAERGVKVYVIVYKEIAAALTCNSAHTKSAMEQLCPRGSKGHGNVVCMRHPDHSPLKHGADMTFYWAHHEKLIVVDGATAFVGGLDLCFGRWDTRQHPLADVHPDGVAAEVWPGQDYNNNRVMDFQKVEDWTKNQLDKTVYGRMPWHDVAIGFTGPAVDDVAQHFVGRWNFIKRDKYKRNSKYPWLRLDGIEDALLGVEHPRFPMGGYLTHPLSSEGGNPGPRPLPSSSSQLSSKEGAEIQLVRSAADWSHGIAPKEHSIQNAYIAAISTAQNFVYIENQFFITSTTPSDSKSTRNPEFPVANRIGAAIVEAISRAHAEDRKFRVIVVMPAIPGFPGDLRQDSATGTRAIIDYQYKSICRGEHSIFGRLRARGIDPGAYIRFFNLRVWDRINNSQALREREAQTGVKYAEAQAANAADVLGAQGVTGDSSSSDSSARSSIESSGIAERRARFEAAEGASKPARDTIADCVLTGGGKLEDEQNTECVEDFVQEELYIHAKVCIVDDATLIIGSANINDRSQAGDHDSELACVVKHSPIVKALRRRLWAEHLGEITPQAVWVEDEAGEDEADVTPPGDGFPKQDTELEDGLADALDDDLWTRWCGQAGRNTEIYRALFHADPDDAIRTWADYDAFCPRREDRKAGHVWVASDHKAAGAVGDVEGADGAAGEGQGKGGKGGKGEGKGKDGAGKDGKGGTEGNGDAINGGEVKDWTVKEVKEMLAEVRGHLVDLPLRFLEGEQMAEPGLQVNRVTESIYT
ncbi:phospholipase D/transphosphatidylase [Geopyxis carbonaria]|nr:phospholipase D/transphosphatidylase [Geopyxis carbonaria]